MTPERWHEVKEIFQQALEREPSLRSTYLAEACSADPSLREEVESLLAFHQQARSFIETPAIEAKIELLAEEPSASMVGKRMGAYQMIGEIGQGGMGTRKMFIQAGSRGSVWISVEKKNLPSSARVWLL